MAKGNMLLGHARGKVGSLVFSRLNGKQITRALAEKVSNPRTDGQNVQRSVFATVNKFASATRSIVDHSFQGINEGNDSVNRFVSINVKKLRQQYLDGVDVDIMPKGAGFPYANTYRMSQGSLGLQRLFVSSGTTKYFAVYEEEDWEGYVTDTTMLSKLIPAFAPGCEFAVLKVYYNEDEHYHYVTYDRAVFKSSFDGIDPGNPVIGAAGINVTYLDDSKTTNSGLITVKGGNSGVKSLAVSEAISGSFSGDTLVACAFFVSQKDSTTGKWMYTTSDMVCVPDYAASHDIADAVNSYGNASKSESTSDLYLQQSAVEQQGGEATPLGEITYNVALQGNGLSSSPDYCEYEGNDSNTVVTTPIANGWAMIQFNFPTEGNVIKKIQTKYTNEQGVVDNSRLTQSSNKSGNVVTVETVINQVDDATAIGGKLEYWVISGSGEQVHFQIDFDPDEN